jgi:hypothetical protein
MSCVSWNGFYERPRCTIILGLCILRNIVVNASDTISARNYTRIVQCYCVKLCNRRTFTIFFVLSENLHFNLFSYGSSFFSSVYFISDGTNSLTRDPMRCLDFRRTVDHILTKKKKKHVSFVFSHRTDIWTLTRLDSVFCKDFFF